VELWALAGKGPTRAPQAAVRSSVPVAPAARALLPTVPRIVTAPRPPISLFGATTGPVRTASSDTPAQGRLDYRILAVAYHARDSVRAGGSFGGPV
jgi:hypothetical protein